jgi:hypothetical protein
MKMNYRANTHWYFLTAVGILTLGVASRFDFRLRSTTVAERSIASEQISSTRQSDNLFFTLNPKTVVEGPFLGDLSYLVSEEYSTRNFVNQTFSLIAQHSLQKLKGYTNAKDHFAVKAFILASLLTPFHESRWTHFRALPVLFDKCIEKRNNGKIFEGVKGSRKATVIAAFEEHFRTQNSLGIEPIVDCSEISRSNPAVQLLGSSDLLSTGLYQPVMLFGHLKDYYEPQSFLSLDDSIAYGVAYLFDGFRKLYGTVQKYKCLYKTVENPKTKEKEQVLDIHLFVRGLWAGHFNSGHVTKTCRFTDPDHEYSKNDKNFKTDLDLFLNLHTENSAFYKWLDPTNRKFFAKLVSSKLEAMDLSPASIRLPKPVTAFDSRRVVETEPETEPEPEPEPEQEQPETKTEAPVKEVESSTSPTNTINKKIRVVNCTTLNTREKPPRGKIGPVLNVGEEYEFVSKKKMTTQSTYDWYEIIYNGKTLWVYGKFVEEVKQ